MVGLILFAGLSGGVGVYAYLNRRPAIDPVLLTATVADADARTMLERLVAAVRSDPTSAEAHGRLGIGYFAAELYGEARRCFDNALILAPGSTRWRYFIAVVSMRVGQSADALPRLQALAKDLPRSASVRHRLATAMFDGGDFAAAEKEYAATTELAPGAPHGFVGLAKVANARGEHEAAAKQAQRALSCDADFAAAHNELGLALRALGRVAEAAAELSKGAGANRGENYIFDESMAEISAMKVGRDATMDRAERLMRAGKGAEAEALLKTLADKSAGDATVMNNYGTVVQQNGDARRAKDIFLRGVEIDPENVPLQISLASSFAQIGELDSALKHARQAVALAPQNANAHFTLGHVQKALRRNGPAVESYRTAVRLDGRHSFALKEMVDALVADKKYADAIAPLKSALQIDPQDVQGHITLTELYLETGQTAAAAAAVIPAVRLAPQNPLVRKLAQRVGLGDR